MQSRHWGQPCSPAPYIVWFQSFWQIGRQSVRLVHVANGALVHGNCYHCRVKSLMFIYTVMLSNCRLLVSGLIVFCAATSDGHWHIVGI